MAGGGVDSWTPGLPDAASRSWGFPAMPLRNAGASKHSVPRLLVPDEPGIDPPSVAAIPFSGHPCPEILTVAEC